MTVLVKEYITMVKIKEMSIATPTGIWNDAESTLSIYPDRAIAVVPFVEWAGSSGSLSYRRFRIAGADHTLILSLLADTCDSDIWDIVFGYHR